MLPLILLAVFNSLPSLAIHLNLPRRAGLHERLLPITSTTTVVVEMTQTQTVWVQPTEQVAFAPSTTSASTDSTSSTSIASSSAVSSVSVDDFTASTTSAMSLSTTIDATSAVTASTYTPSLPSSLSSSSPSFSDSSSLASIFASVSATTDSASLTGGSSAVLASTTSVVPPSATSISSAFSPVAPSGSRSGASRSSPPAFSGSGPPRSRPATTLTMSSTAVPSVTSSTTVSADNASSSSLNPVSATLASITTTSDLASSTTSAVSVTEAATFATARTFATAATASTSYTAAAASSTLQSLGSTLMNGYYPDWSGWYLAPESVDWSKFDVIDFAFALPTADFGLEFTQDDSSDLLTRLVQTGHAAGKRVKLSIGGWTGSTYFSTICASAANRRTFVSNIMAAFYAYNLDGIDIDWEYPGTTGSNGNAVSRDDSANFLYFLNELRVALPDGALISTATQVWPFADSNGNPMSDVSGFAQVIDYILIMNYDVWGSSSTPGANAPLSDGCSNSSQPLANAYAAISSWTSAGMPANQITLGVPAYGYLQKSGAIALKDRRSLVAPPGRRNRNVPRDYVTVYNDNGGSADGQIMFESLISQGALALDGSGSYAAAGGFTREWDSCSSTPWLRSSQSGQIVTYDDPQSMSLKGQFAAQAGLRGCNVFSIDGDWTGSAWPLTDAARSGLGL